MLPENAIRRPFERSPLPLVVKLGLLFVVYFLSLAVAADLFHSPNGGVMGRSSPAPTPAVE